MKRRTAAPPMPPAMPAMAPVERPEEEEPAVGWGAEVSEVVVPVFVLVGSDVGVLVAVFVTVSVFGVIVTVLVEVTVVWAPTTRVLVWKMVVRTIEEVGTVVVVGMKEVTSLVRVILVVMTVEDEIGVSASWVALNARFWIGADREVVGGVHGKEKRL